MEADVSCSRRVNLGRIRSVVLPPFAHVSGNPLLNPSARPGPRAKPHDAAPEASHRTGARPVP